MEAKIRIHGKSQSRTALGIVNAYLKLYPDATLSELQKVFPKSLNSKSPGDNIIVPVKKTKGHEKQFFEHEDELIVLNDGKKLALVEVWQKEDFDAICEHAKQFGIEVAEMEKAIPFEKGSYHLEYINDYVPPVAVEKKKCKCCCRWWWWILLLLLLLLLLFFCCKYCCKDKCCSKADAPIEEVMPNPINDTGDAVTLALPNGTECTIDKNSPEYKLFAFLNSDDEVNADDAMGWIPMDKLLFEKGKVQLTTPEAESQLKNIAAILKFFPNSRIKIGGYADKTGSNKINRRISAERAQNAAGNLIGLGIEAERITQEGYGSQNPVCQANDTENCRAANRRIDVKVTQK